MTLINDLFGQASAGESKKMASSNLTKINNMYKNTETKLILGDTLRNLEKLDKGKFDLIITSPPYNLGKEYENKESIERYLDKQGRVIEQLVKLTSKRGSICWQIGNYVNKGEIFPLDIFYYNIFKKHGLKLRNRLIWHFGHGLHASKRFSGRYETILWFSKSNDYIFNLDNVRIPAKYPGKKHFKGPKRGKLSGNPNGKNPSDVWEILSKDWEKGFWNIPNVKANHPEKTTHPCQFPVELVERCILALTKEGSWVLDPYAGVGSTLIAAMKNNRNAIGIDSNKKNIETAKKRLLMLKNNKLKLRPINKPIHNPSPNDKMARIPKEWMKGAYVCV